jgi:ribonuclease HI
VSQGHLFGEPVSRVIVYTDGGARGNPGPAALGVSIQTPDGDELAAIGETIGETTNNVAEYSAVVVGLKRAAELGAREVEVRSDSMLMVEQVNGRYKIRTPHLKALIDEIHTAARAFDAVTYTHVPRERNVRADELVNRALDDEG